MNITIIIVIVAIVVGVMAAYFISRCIIRASETKVSIKESISSVEAICEIIAGKKITLGGA